MTKFFTPKQKDFLEALLGEARGHIRVAMDMALSSILDELKMQNTERNGAQTLDICPTLAWQDGCKGNYGE